MPYAKFDDRYDDHRKIKRAWRRAPAAVGMHAMAITYCNRHITDGLIDDDWVQEKLELMHGNATQRAKVLDTLLDAGLFERVDSSTFLVHDFLDWNMSREQRESLAEQGRRGGRAKAERHSNGSSPPPSGGSSQGQSDGQSQGSSTPRHATPTEKKNVNTNAELRSAATECFAYWQERCCHPSAQLSTDRRHKLEARLRDRRAHHDGDLHAAILDVRLAIEGAARDAHVNDQGKRFDDIELICRNGSKLESFMDRAVAVPLRAVPNSRRENASDLLRRLDAANTDTTIEGTAS
jgi:hypothetical protein